MSKKYFIVQHGKREEVDTYNDLIEAASMAIAAAHDSDYNVNIKLRSGKNDNGLLKTEIIYLYIDTGVAA